MIELFLYDGGTIRINPNHVIAYRSGQMYTIIDTIKDSYKVNENQNVITALIHDEAIASYKRLQQGFGED